MSIKKFGSAHWEGSVKQGRGKVSTESGALADQPYGFNTRFEGVPGSNPEELIGAAHAGCFSMAFSMMLGEAGFEPEAIDTQATVTLDPDSLTVTGVHLDTTARVPGCDQAAFDQAAQGAKDNCPISKLLNAEITLDAKLTG
ncbi:OsmC family protein [Halomonas beimenensis]|uniref:Osmotically inducible protein C n=1 Tax=Halomonas beimenensis TaxID=475662 RepID=A0A291P9R1_9GAMM|nr:OsmC family protein [Halomonas beimenensis]ATJ83615.1 osmotically inducible protein C [Halomonas beimenensis]